MARHFPDDRRSARQAAAPDVLLPDDLPLPGIVERLAALLPPETALRIDTRAGSPRGFAVLSVGGTAYTLATGSLFNVYPWACHEPAMLADRLADIENAVRFARRKAGFAS